jgi:hypothetical protein
MSSPSTGPASSSSLFLFLSSSLFSSSLLQFRHPPRSSTLLLSCTLLLSYTLLLSTTLLPAPLLYYLQRCVSICLHVSPPFSSLSFLVFHHLPCPSFTISLASLLPFLLSVIRLLQLRLPSRLGPILLRRVPHPFLRPRQSLLNHRGCCWMRRRLFDLLALFLRRFHRRLALTLTERSLSSTRSGWILHS